MNTIKGFDRAAYNLETMPVSGMDEHDQYGHYRQVVELRRQLDAVPQIGIDAIKARLDAMIYEYESSL